MVKVYFIIFSFQVFLQTLNFLQNKTQVVLATRSGILGCVAVFVHSLTWYLARSKSMYTFLWLADGF